MALTISLTAGRLASSSPLLNLPEEIQILIYGFAVVEPPRWTKRHDITCKYTPSRCNEMERPPFALSEVNFRHKDRGLNTNTDCSCGKRKGLSLLLASKFINELAAPIFWSENTFCFLDAVEFIAAVKHALRPRYREMIQSLSIISPDPQGRPTHVNFSPDRSKYMDAFWETLKECESLRKLEISPPYIQSSKKVPTHEHLNELPKVLPNLSTLSLSFLLPISRFDLGLDYPPPWYHDHWSHQYMYVKCSSLLPILREESWTAEELQDVFRTFHFNFRVYITTASKVHFCGADVEKLDTYRSSWRIPKSLNEKSNVRRLKLPTGETTVVEVYGVPLSSKARKARARYAKAEALKMERSQAGLRAAEHAAMKTGQERRRKGREDSMERERGEYQTLQLARGVRRVDLEAMEAKDARNTVKNEKESLRKDMKSAEENRRLERKRVVAAPRV